jgi:hypothetical protein
MPSWILVDCERNDRIEYKLELCQVRSAIDAVITACSLRSIYHCCKSRILLNCPHLRPVYASHLPVMPPFALVVLVDQLLIFITCSLLRQVVHRSDRSLFDSAIVLAFFLWPLYQLYVSVITCSARQPRNALISRDARVHPRVRSGLAARAQLACDCVPEEVQEWASNRWHAGTDDADIAFHATPESDRVVVVCRIGIVSNLRDVLQSDDTAECDEQADEEGEDHANFTSRISDLELS